MKPTLQVAVAIVYHDDGRVLISKRSADKDHAGDWEFPGGKIEPGETPYEGLVRECREEMAIEVQSARPLITIPYDYEPYSVCLHVFEVTRYQGEPASQDNQETGWSTREALQSLKFPEANQGIVRALVLPAVYLITPDHEQPLADFTRQLKACFEQGVTLCRVRQGRLSDSVYFARLIAALDFAKQYSVKIMMDGLPDPRWSEVAGWHLNMEQLYQCYQRPLTQGKWLAASLHSQRDVAQANRLRCDFAVLSPIKPTASHPDANPLGWPLFAEWTALAHMPVFALGGMTPQDATQAWKHGGQGVAGIEGLWSLNNNLSEVMPLRA